MAEPTEVSIKNDQPFGWISIGSYKKLSKGAQSGDYAFVCRVYAGPEKPRKRDSSGWIPVFTPA